MSLVRRERIRERIAAGRHGPALVVDRDAAGRRVPGERRAGRGPGVVVGEQVPLAAHHLDLRLDVGRVGVRRHRSGRVVGEQHRLQVGDLAHDGLEIVHVALLRRTPARADRSQRVVAEAPPPETVRALDDRHEGVVAHLGARRPPSLRGELEELEHRHPRPRILHGVAGDPGAVGDRAHAIAAGGLGAEHRVGIGAEHVGRVTPQAGIGLRQQRGERHAVGIETTQPVVLREAAVPEIRPALVDRVIAGAATLRADILKVGVRAVDQERVVGRKLVEAVPGLEIHDPVLLEVRHQRVHLGSRGGAVPVVQVEVDPEAVHVALSGVGPQQVFPEDVVAAVAHAGVVHAEHEARRAPDEEAILGVDRDVHRRPRAAGDLRHAIGRVRVGDTARRGVDHGEDDLIRASGLHAAAVDLRDEVCGRREVLARQLLAGALVLEGATDLHATEVTARRRDRHVEPHRLRLIVEQHAAVVRVEHEDVDRLRELLDHDDVVEPRRPRRAAEVLEAQRRLQILGHDDASDLVERPVSGALDGIGREPLTDAAGTEVDLQSQAGVAAADTLRLDPGAEVVDAGLQEDRLVGRRSVAPAIAEGARMRRLLIEGPATAAGPAGRYPTAVRFEAGVLGQVRAQRRRRHRRQPTRYQVGLGHRRGRQSRESRHCCYCRHHPPSHAHPHRKSLPGLQNWGIFFPAAMGKAMHTPELASYRRGGFLRH